MSISKANDSSNPNLNDGPRLSSESLLGLDLLSQDAVNDSLIFEDLETRGGDVLEDLTDHRRLQLSKLRSHIKIPQRLVDEE